VASTPASTREREGPDERGLLNDAKWPRAVSSCRSPCPHNKFVFTSDPALALDLFEVFSYAVLALAAVVAAVETGSVR